jgi:plastocyanin
LLALAAAACALALAPQAASAAPPTGCTQTNSPPPGEPTEWTCYEAAVTVAGYEVKRGTRFNIPKPGVNGSITHMEVDLVDQNSAQVPIDRLMLHHIVFLNGNRPDAACGGPERFYGAGEERAKISFPDGYGYPANTGHAWFMTYMFMNHRALTDTAYIEYKLTVDPDPAIQSVRSYWLDVGNCKPDPIYNVPGAGAAATKRCKKVGKRAKPAARKRAAKCRKAAKQRRRTAASAPVETTHTLTKDVAIKENGWIIAGAGHVHGGAQKLTITKPSCGNLQVAESLPTWGNADHPFYNVKPVLHEPGPIGMSAFKSPTGIPVTQGQAIRLNSIYDNLQPHTRVMGIYITYLAPDPPGGPAPSACGGAPTDLVYGPGTDLSGRSTPPPFTVPLTGLDAGGNAVEIDGPPGEFKTLTSGDTITVGDRFFSQPNVIVKPGTTLNYVFNGNEDHNLTLANGPLGIGSPDMSGGATYSQSFERTGTYRFFCGLHPVQMSERVVVKSAKKKKKARGKKRRANRS